TKPGSSNSICRRQLPEAGYSSSCRRSWSCSSFAAYFGRSLLKMTAAATPPTRRRRRLGADALIRIVYLALFLVFLLAPLYWVLVTSTKPVDDYMAIPPVCFPPSPTIIHFRAALFS